MTGKEQTGVLYGIGLGPGDPELITVKGKRILESVPVIFAPLKAGGGVSQAIRIAEPWIDRGRQRVIELPLPMTLDPDVLREAWAEALIVMTDVLQAGEDAAYLLVGDPMLYGTFLYCIEGLRKGWPHLQVQVVPGITSISAVAAAACWPLAKGEERMAIIPAVHSQEDLEELLPLFDTVALMKPGSQAGEMLSTLQRLGWAADAVYAEKVGFPEAYMTRDLSNLEDRASFPYLSLVLARRSSERMKDEG